MAILEKKGHTINIMEYYGSQKLLEVIQGMIQKESENLPPGKTVTIKIHEKDSLIYNLHIHIIKINQQIY